MRRSYNEAVETTVTNLGLALAGAHVEPPPVQGWLGALVVLGGFGGIAALAVYQHRQGRKAWARYRVSCLPGVLALPCELPLGPP